MIISVHVPKCAGTSFGRILETQHGDRLWKNYGAIFTREEARKDLIPDGTQCIHGHFFADAFSDLFPAGQLITWVRHPVERVVSNYQFFRRNPGIQDACCQALHQRRLTLTEFADLDWMRNEATRYLAGKSFNDFAFVGVAERFAESLSLYHSLFGGFPTGPLPQDNVNPHRRTLKYPLSAEEYGYIIDRNIADLRWYNQALVAIENRSAVPEWIAR